MDRETRILLNAVYAGKIKHEGNARHIRIEALREGVAEMKRVLEAGAEALRRGEEALALMEESERNNLPF